MRLSFIKKHSPSILLSVISLLMASGLQGQALIITGGQGQISQNNALPSNNLSVQLLDAAGKPFPGQIVNFVENSNGQNGQINSTPPPTDINGITSVQFRGANIALGSGVAFVQTTVTASFGSASVVFTETTSGTTTGGPSVQIFVQSPLPGQPIGGAAGSSSNVPVRVVVGLVSSNTGISNVAVSIAVDPGGTGTITCKEGAVILTDNTGTATCTPLFGKLGSGTFTITVGGAPFGFSIPFNVSVGPPGLITIISGDGQSGTPGQILPLPVKALVTDLAGNPIRCDLGNPNSSSCYQFSFESVTPGGVTFTNTRSNNDGNGNISTSVILGNGAGPVQIRIRDTANLVTSPAIVTETVINTISGLTKNSGDNQTAFINAPFPTPLSVRVTSATGAVSATVTFAVTSGSATLSPATILTDSGGNAATTVTAGPTAGPITVTATTGAFTQTFTLTANPPGPTNFTYFNGASFENGKISPGSIVTINALGLVTSNVQGFVGGTLFGVLPYTVAGVSVTIGGIPAPIFYVGNSNGQQSVTIQVPFEVPASTVPITIAVAGGGSTSAFVTILPVAPGVFETAGADGRKRVVALRPNGTVVTTANPAARGENVRVYLTGLGNVTPGVPTGSFSPSGPDPVVTSNLVIGIANNGAPLVQAIYARNLVGVYELTITIPTDTVAFPSGTVAFAVAIQGPNGLVYSQTSAIVIQ